MKKYLIIITIIILHSCDMKKNEIVEPKAKKIDKVLKIHDHERTDEFYWLNERDNPEVIEYLNEENNYRDYYMKDYQGLENELFEEIKSRIKEDDSSVHTLKTDTIIIHVMKKGSNILFIAEKKIILKMLKKF